MLRPYHLMLLCGLTWQTLACSGVIFAQVGTGQLTRPPRQERPSPTVPPAQNPGSGGSMGHGHGGSGHGGHGHGRPGNVQHNFFFGNGINYGYPGPGFGYGYPYYDGYGYGGYYGGFGGPFLYPPAVTVVPHGVPLTSDILNGRFSTPIIPYGYDFGINDPSVIVARPNFPAAGGNGQVPPLANGQVQPPPPAPPKPREEMDEIKRRVGVLKSSDEAGRLRSDELMADGDREFAAQEYRRAAAKYREAIAKAPDYSPSHLRAGHAYIATGDYDLAVTYFAMGFELSRTIERPGFSLADLYRGNNLAKEQHHEALADAVLRQPQDGSLLFLTGVTQHYDGRPLQAREYFQRAAKMPGRHQPYAAMFLPADKDED